MSRPLRVFLCHASQDKPAVRELYNALKSEYWIDPWLDKAKILPGQDWEMVIEKAVDASDVVVICLSNQSVTKEGFVQREIRYAYDLALEKPEDTIFLIPLRLDDCPVPRKLRTFHWVDYFGAQKQEAYSDLLEALQLRYDQKIKLEVQEEEREREERQAKQEAEELARKLAAEKAAREKAEREIAENAVREERAREAKKKLESERLRVAREKVEREQRERDAAEKVKHEVAQKAELAQESAERRKRSREAGIKTVQNFLPNLKILALVLVIGIIGYFLWRGISSIPLRPELTPTTTVVLAPTTSATFTIVPFSETKTPTHTKAATPAPTLGAGSTMISKKDDMTMVYVPAGEFIMGSEKGEPDEKPAHTVYLDAFWIYQTEVTNKQYQACVDAGVCEPPSSFRSYTHPSYYGNPEFDNYPVLFVNWGKANRYCEVWAGGDLPTEAQWEKAARGHLTNLGNGNIYPWGEGIGCDKANYQVGCLGDTSPAGSYESGKSPYGAYDMAGNVWEWVNDYYQSDYYALIADNASNPNGPSSGGHNVLRGGSWYAHTDNARSTSTDRDGDTPQNASPDIGFRCVRSE